MTLMPFIFTESEFADIVDEQALFDIANRCGLSEEFVKDTFEVMGKFAALGLDSYEESLLACVAAVSPDRQIETNFDYEVLTALQVNLRNMLRSLLGTCFHH